MKTASGTEICNVFGKCGGCLFLDIPYKKQIEIKRNFLINLFNREIDVIPSPRIYYYRNRMDFSIVDSVIGLRERKKWWKVVQTKNCLLLSRISNKILERLKEFMKEKNLKGWDFKKQKGDLRYIVIREGKFTKKRMVNIVIGNKEIFEKVKEFFKEIQDFISTGYIGINDTLSDTSYSFEKYNVFGEKYLKEKILGFEYLIGPNSFFQTNSYTCEILIQKVLDFLDPKGNEIVYDMYSGVGTFSVAIGNYVKKIVGVEVEKEAVELYKENMKINGIKNYDIMHSRVEDLNKVEGDIFIFDPPRSGINKKIIKLVNKSKPKKIIYVSCNPKTQKRDIDLLNEIGYELIDIIAIDQFPHTDHIETVALLELKL